MKIGIIREGKVPSDKRVAFTPKQCKKIRESYPQIYITVQSSPHRAYMDEEYDERCFVPVDDLTHCDILFGIKEVPVEELIADKTYFFFSHTIKKQPYNKGLLQAVLEKNITLLDYELITDDDGNRLLGFGRFAGLVGAYNGLKAYAIRVGLPEPKSAHTLPTLSEMKEEASNIELPPIRIAFTGEGRVASGVRELLEEMGVRELDVDTYLRGDRYSEPVFVQLKPGDYNKRKDGTAFDLKHFFANPGEYEGNFKRFCSETDLFISSAFWDPKAPVLFTREDMLEDNFCIKVIADITCDIQGSIPSTLRSSMILDPFYGYNPKTGKEEDAFYRDENITIMAVDNLPNELPRDASKMFGKAIKEHVLPLLVNDTENAILERATIVKNGKLTERFKYLEEWVKSE